MAFVEQITPTSLKTTAARYAYDAEQFHAFEQSIWGRIQQYNGKFGHTVIEHLNRTSRDFANMLRMIDTEDDYGIITRKYDESSITNLTSAFKLHDAGKILQPATLWGLEEKPGDEIKKKRTEHVDLGIEVLKQAIEQFPELEGHPHISVIECLMRYHHERINGAGPKKLHGEQLGEVLEIAGIVDTVDGKIIPRGPNPSSMPQALRDMTGDRAYTSITKHSGEFRRSLLFKAIEYYQGQTPEWILPRPIGHSEPALAM